MLYVRVVHFGELVLLFLGDEAALDSSVPLISTLSLEDGPELLLRILNVIEWRPLVHTVLANAAIACQHDVQLTV